MEKIAAFFKKELQRQNWIDNAYNTEVIDNYPVRIIVDKKRSPIIANATTDAMISGQIGQPAAKIICHTMRLPKIKNGD